MFPLTIIEITSIFLLFLCSAKIIFEKNGVRLVKIPFISLALFIFLVLLQLIALPRGLLQYLSPGTAQLYLDFGFISMKNLTLSVYPDMTLGMLLQFLSYLAVFFVIINYFDTDEKVQRVILVIIFSGFVYSFYGVIERFTIVGVEFSTFTNRNHFSAYIQMIIPLAIGYSLTRRSVAIRSIFIFLASTMLLALFLALSRAGIICIVLSLLILAIILRMKYTLKKDAAIIILVVLLFSVLLGVFVGFDPTMQRLKTLVTPFQVLAIRLSLIKDTLSIFKDFPLWGVGLGVFGEIFQKYKSLGGAVETYSFAHNEPLQLIAETGLLGFLSVTVFLFGYLKRILHLLFKRRNLHVIYLSLGCLVGLTSIFLHSFFDFVFHIPANALLFVIILALINRILCIQQKDKDPDEQEFKINLPQHLKVISIIIFATLLLLVASLILNRYKAEQIFQSVKEIGPGIPKSDVIFTYRKKLKVLNKAITLNPLNSSYHNKKADILSGLAVRDDLRVELLSFEEFGDTQRLLDIAGESYKRAIELNPTRADYHLRLGWFYGVTGENKLTKEEFNKAISLDPRNSRISTYVDEYFKESKAP